MSVTITVSGIVITVDNSEIQAQLTELKNLIIGGITKMTAELDALTAEVAAETAVETSAIALIQGLAAKITAAGTDPIALAALTAQMTTSSAALAAAVAANTPAAPVPPAPTA